MKCDMCGDEIGEMNFIRVQTIENYKDDDIVDGKTTIVNLENVLRVNNFCKLECAKKYFSGEHTIEEAIPDVEIGNPFGE